MITIIGGIEHRSDSDVNTNVRHIIYMRGSKVARSGRMNEQRCEMDTMV